MPQVPRMTVERVLSLSSNDPNSPFYDSTGTPMKPIAKIHLMRQRLYEKSCTEEDPKSESAGLFLIFLHSTINIIRILFQLFVNH